MESPLARCLRSTLDGALAAPFSVIVLDVLRDRLSPMPSTQRYDPIKTFALD